MATEFPYQEAWRSLGGLAGKGDIARVLIEDDPTRKKDFSRYVLHATNPDIDYSGDAFSARFDQFLNTSLREMRQRKIKRIILDVARDMKDNAGRGSYYPDDFANKNVVSDMNGDKLGYLFAKQPWKGKDGVFMSSNGNPVFEVKD